MKSKTINKALKRGQILVFMVLIFPIFFIFGAMVINIGMVVHDKINLQNSVDLAAIYGAQKQAEILNALAHINYQIRQSYKLMAWRYLVLGNFGSNYKRGDNFYRMSPNGNQDEQHCNALLNTCTPGACDQPNNGACAYAVCMGHNFWDWSRGDHLCQKASLGASPIPRPQTLPAASRLFRAVGINFLDNFIQRANLRLDESCKGMQTLNWYTASTFLLHFRYDQRKRKVLAMKLFNEVLANRKDIEGNDLSIGIENTIKNNLTYINYINYNDSGVVPTVSTPSFNFDQYFEWQLINPMLFYIKSQIDAGDSLCYTALFPIFHTPKILDLSHLVGVNPDEDRLYSSSTGSGLNSSNFTPDNLGHLSSGFFKKQNAKPIYVHVRVDIPYNRQIFFPMRKKILLTAEAFAKPFGASFGPPPNADTLLPTRPFNEGALPNTGNVAPDAYNHLLDLAPNYAAYPGDKQGLFNYAVQAFWTSQLMGNVTGKKRINYIDTQGQLDPMVLSWSTRGVNSYFLNTTIRQFEEMAIAPDLFDITYYTISPNYMTTLYRKILSNRFLKPIVEGIVGAGQIPGDLGYFDPAKYNLTETFSELVVAHKQCGIQEPKQFRLNFIDKQFQCLENYSQDIPPALNKVKLINHVLTSWYPISKGGYNPDGLYTPASRGLFGECIINDSKIKLKLPFEQNGAIQEQKVIPQYCIFGGRSGFSVKLIHESMTN